MLILTRHPGQLIAIQPSPTLHPATPIGRVFADGPIEILVTRVWGATGEFGDFRPWVVGDLSGGEGRGRALTRGGYGGGVTVFVSEVCVPLRSERIIR